MRVAFPLLLASVLLVPAALAQTQPTPRPDLSGSPGAPSRQGTERAAPGNERSIDLGPFTPEASRAHRGGGVILEGAPGAPAPPPQPTPPLPPTPSR